MSALIGILLTALVHDPTSELNALWDRRGEEVKREERQEERKEGKKVEKRRAEFKM